MMTDPRFLSFPVKMGIITGILYCILIYLENRFFYKSPVTFIASKFIFYILIVGCYFYTGWVTRRQLGGYINFQECLRAILVVIAIAELFYLIFNIVYIKYLDPGFIEKCKISTHDFLVSINTPEDKL